MTTRVSKVTAILLAGFAALRLLTRTTIWLLPYNLAGLLSEAGLLAIGGLAALCMYFARLGPAAVRWQTAMLAGSCLYLLLSFAGLGWDLREGAGLGRNRFYVFSAPGCEMLALFPVPPEEGRFVARAGLPMAVDGRYAWLSDLDTVSSLRADCLVLAAPLAPEQRTEAARRILRHWVEEDRVRISGETPLPAKLHVVQVEGSIGGSVLPQTPQSGPRRTFVVARARAGERSILVLSAQQALAFEISERTLRFLESARPR